MASAFQVLQNYHLDLGSVPGAVFMEGLSQVLGLIWLYSYTKVKPKTWLRPFVNTTPGTCKYIVA